MKSTAKSSEINVSSRISTFQTGIPPKKNKTYEHEKGKIFPTLSNDDDGARKSNNNVGSRNYNVGRIFDGISITSASRTNQPL